MPKRRELPSDFEPEASVGAGDERLTGAKLPPAKDLRIAAFSDAQHGVVSRAQLLQAGLTCNEIDHRVTTRRLIVMHRGVYAVGHKRLRAQGRWMAAVLACGEGAVLSHQTAAALWELRGVGSGASHVTVAGDAGRKRRAGIRLHRSSTLAPRDVTVRDGIAVTTVERTIIDLARAGVGDLDEVVHGAGERGLVDFARLKAAKPASLKAVLRAYDPAPTRSKLERRFLSICRRHGIPRPEVNANHRAPHKFESDRERDAELGAKDWRVRRFTWRQLEERPGWVAAMTKRA